VGLADVDHVHREVRKRLTPCSSVLLTVRKGIERAAGYNFTLRGPLRFYVEAMLSFGSDFNTDPQLAWAVEVLNDASEPDELSRALSF
jgi:hypothetical protein